MYNLFSQFMHIYFWVFIVYSLIGLINNWDKEEVKRQAKFNFWSVVAIVLFIMSFKY
jgi:hypothetical protein